MKLKIVITFISIVLIFTIAMAAQPVKINSTAIHKINQNRTPYKTTWLAMQFKKLSIQRDGNTLSWSAIVKNSGPRLQANRVQIKAIQMRAATPIADAGAIIKYRNDIKRSQIMNFGRQAWKKAPLATHLMVEVKDLQTGRFISKKIRLPDN
ncbi:MAG: hypothetical protein GY857_18490 [Desulfobacula sp.]|nr:hypothetical protein [Desulfobacula sp.]